MICLVTPVQRDEFICSSGRKSALIKVSRLTSAAPRNIASSGMSFGYFRMMSPQNIIRFAAPGNFAMDFFQEIEINPAFAFGSQSFLLWPRPKSQVSSQPTLKNWLEKFGSNSS